MLPLILIVKIFINIVNCVVSAGTCFKAAKCYDKASNAFKKAADAHYSSHAYPNWYTPKIAEYLFYSVV